MSDTFSADSKAIGGAVTAAGAGATIAALTGLQAGGRYKVRINLDMAGTVDAANIQNFRLQSGGANIATPLPSVPMGFPIIIDQLTLAPGATDLTVVAIGAFAAGAIAAVSIVATRIG